MVSIGSINGGQKPKAKPRKEVLKIGMKLPCLAPKFIYKKKGEICGVLIEHLSGYTFEKICMSQSDMLLHETEKMLHKTRAQFGQNEDLKKSVLNARLCTQLQKDCRKCIKYICVFKKRTSILWSRQLLSFDCVKLTAACLFESNGHPAFPVYISWWFLCR